MADSPCAGCGKPMGYGDYDVANGKEYHVECFICHFCGKPFPDQRFCTSDDGKLCHGACLDAAERKNTTTAEGNTTTTTAEAAVKVCAGCSNVIADSDKELLSTTATGGAVVFYHPSCFVCSDCGKPIGTAKFAMNHGKPIHTSCAHGAELVSAKPRPNEAVGAGPTASTPTPAAGNTVASDPPAAAAAQEFDAELTCDRCQKAIKGQKKVVPEFGNFHLSCFRCSNCSLGITKEFFKDPATGKPRCHRCPL